MRQREFARDLPESVTGARCWVLGLKFGSSFWESDVVGVPVIARNSKSFSQNRSLWLRALELV